MGTTRLEIYQRAILHCKQTPVTSLGEANEARRLCDVHYAPMLQCIMEAGFWTHAMRTTEITVNAGVTPAFGYAHAHDMPSDLVRKYAVSASETMQPPLDYQAGGTAYLIEGGYLWADSTPLYLRYTSSDAGYGLDLTRWPERQFRQRKVWTGISTSARRPVSSTGQRRPAPGHQAAALSGLWV